MSMCMLSCSVAMLFVYVQRADRIFAQRIASSLCRICDAAMARARIDQATLASLWRSAPAGKLSPWEQAKALALREAHQDLHGHVCLSWVAARVMKTGGGNPTKQSMDEFFRKVDADPEWYPGKHHGGKRGPRVSLTTAKRKILAASAMAIKARGAEPTPIEVMQRCKKASFNPRTKRPFCEKTVKKVFLEDCYDFDPDSPWKHQAPLQKVFIPDDVKRRRVAMAQHILCQERSGQWWFQQVLWFDPCASIIPGSAAQYLKMRQASLSSKRYISDDAKLYSRNLRGPPTALKQRTWEGTKVNWFMVLTRGRAHVEVMPHDWELDGAGLAQFVERLPGLLRRMFGPLARLPRTVFTDRGTGMYSPGGLIVGRFEAAIKESGMRTFWGPDAAMQSPDMSDLLLHETAVALFRKGMRSEKPCVAPWQETQAQWTERAARVVDWMNTSCDLTALCHEFPQRLVAVRDAEGDRLKK